MAKTLILVGLALCALSSAALAQGSPLLGTEDKFFLQTRLGVALDNEAICRLTEAEATRLHRLIRAGDVGDIQAYLNNVILDQVFDTAHRWPRADRCPDPPR